MDPLEKKIYYSTFYSIFYRLSPFYREWLALTKIIMISTFSKKDKSKLVKLWPIEAIHSENDLTCNN